jgi:site-specific recombinase XerD
MSTVTVSPLRQRMIEDMNARKLCAGTQRSHIRSCKRFAAFLKRNPDTAAAEDIRRFQLHLSETGVSICTRNGIMTGLRFLFRVTLRRLDLAAEIYHIREPQKIPLVMSQDETRRLLAVASSLKARVLLSLGYGCGLRAGEVVRLKVKTSTARRRSFGSSSPRAARTATSCCHPTRSTCCANGGRRAGGVSIPQLPWRSAGCFPAKDLASR